MESLAEMAKLRVADGQLEPESLKRLAETDCVATTKAKHGQRAPGSLRLRPPPMYYFLACLASPASTKLRGEVAELVDGGGLLSEVFGRIRADSALLAG